MTTYCSTTWAPISCHLDTLNKIEEVNNIDDGKNSTTGSPFAGEGRIVETDFGPQAFVLINVYIPNAGERPDRPRLATKLKFLKSLKAHCETLAAQGRRVLLVGDFNVCADERDVHPRIGLENAYSEEERNLFLSFLIDHGGIFIDTWRHLHPDSTKTPNTDTVAAAAAAGTSTTSLPGTTTSISADPGGVYSVWDEKTSARAFNQGVRIDFILATPNVLPFIKTCEILGQDVLPPKWSDHAGILVEIEENNKKVKDGTKDVEVEVKESYVEVFAPPEKHPPCKEWVKLHRRFHDPSQKSILSMFGGAAGGGGGGGGQGVKRKKAESSLEGRVKIRNKIEKQQK